MFYLLFVTDAGTAVSSTPPTQHSSASSTANQSEFYIFPLGVILVEQSKAFVGTASGVDKNGIARKTNNPNTHSVLNTLVNFSDTQLAFFRGRRREFESANKREHPLRVRVPADSTLRANPSEVRYSQNC